MSSSGVPPGRTGGSFWLGETEEEEEEDGHGQRWTQRLLLDLAAPGCVPAPVLRQGRRQSGVLDRDSALQEDTEVGPRAPVHHRGRRLSPGTLLAWTRSAFVSPAACRPPGGSAGVLRQGAASTGGAVSPGCKTGAGLQLTEDA